MRNAFSIGLRSPLTPLISPPGFGPVLALRFCFTVWLLLLLFAPAVFFTRCFFIIFLHIQYLFCAGIIRWTKRHESRSYVSCERYATNGRCFIEKMPVMNCMSGGYRRKMKVFFKRSFDGAKIRGIFEMCKMFNKKYFYRYLFSGKTDWYTIIYALKNIIRLFYILYLIFRLISLKYPDVF